MKKMIYVVFVFILASNLYLLEKQYQNSRKVKFSFTLTDMKPFMKVKRLILWITEDNGINWYRADKFGIKRTDKGENFIEWEAPKDGDFGFILTYELEGLKESPKPTLFDLPQYIVTVDTKPPKIIYFKGRYINKKKGILKIQWKIADKNLSYQGAKLLYKKNGEFQYINDNLPEDGETIWYVTDTSKKYLKFMIKATDLTGNEITKTITKRNTKYARVQLVQPPIKEQPKLTEPSRRDRPPSVVSEKVVQPVYEHEQEKKTEEIVTQTIKEEPIVKKKEEPETVEVKEQKLEQKTEVKSVKEEPKKIVAKGKEKKDAKKVIPFRIPLNIKGNKDNILNVTVYYTIDKGKTWEKYSQISPYDTYMTFFAENEKLYGFYFVFKTKDGINFPDEPKSETAPNLYKYIDITAPKLKLYTPANNILFAGKTYKVGWKIYDTNLNPSSTKLSVSYDKGKTWQILEQGFAKKGRKEFLTPLKNLESSLIFKLEANDLSGLVSSVLSKIYTVRKYDFEITFTEAKSEVKKSTHKYRKKKVNKSTVTIPQMESKLKVYNDIENLLNKAKISASKGQFYDAVENLNKILKMDKNNFDALSLLGYIYTVQENYSESIKMLTQAFSIACEDFTNFYNLQISLIKVNNIFDSISKLTDFFKCVSTGSLDKNKLDKIQVIMSNIDKKVTALGDSTLKNKLRYLKNFINTPSFEAARK